MKSFRSFSFFFFFLLFYFTICSCLFIDGTNKDVEDAVVKFEEDGCQPTSKVCRIYGNVCTGFRLLTSVFQNRTEPHLRQLCTWAEITIPRPRLFLKARSRFFESFL